MSLYFGYKKPQTDTEELEKSIKALKSTLSTNNVKTVALDGKLTLLETGKVTTLETKVSSLESKVSTAETDITNIKSTNTTQNTCIQSNWTKNAQQDADIQNILIKNVSQDTTISNIEAAAASNLLQTLDNKTNIATNKPNTTALAVRVTTLESISRVYTYHFDYLTLDTSWSYPTTNAGSVPYHWMYCKNMFSRSKFHVHALSYDNDASLDSNFTFTFKLDFFKANGDHIPKEVFTARRGDHIISGERLLFIDKKFSPSTLTGYHDFVMARLAIKVSAVKGNEVSVSCSFEI